MTEDRPISGNSEGTTRLTSAEDFLAGGGKMAALIGSMDWSNSPLGPIESWPQSLRTTLSLCLASNFPLCFVWGPERVQIYNDGYWPICGAKHPVSMGQDFKKCWSPAWPVIGPGFEACMATGETTFLTDTRLFIDRNGYLEETFFTFSYSPIRDETGAIAGIFHPVNETTHLVLAERRMGVLRDLAHRTANCGSVTGALEAAAEALASHPLDLPFALLYRVDAGGKSATLTAATGLESGAIGAPERVDFDGNDIGGWPIAKVVRSESTETVADLGSRFVTLDCGPYEEPPSTALAIPIPLAGSDHLAAVLVAGVSPRRELDDAYRGFFDMLATAVATAVANAHAFEEEKRRAEALAELDRAKTTFFSNVSHELRTPLTLMLGPLENALADGSLTSERRQHLDLAYRNSLRLLKLVNALLDFSRIEAGRMQVSYQPTDLAALTAELASVFHSAIDLAGLRLVVDCPSLPEPVYVDREMWEKVVLNLVSNALKFTFEGEIAVRLRPQGEFVELSVEDTGVGIPAAELPRVFERFHRVEGTRSRTHDGTGIGLALTQELARLHGGDVDVRSVEGQGSTFVVTVRLGTSHLPPEHVVGKSGDRVATGRDAPFVQEAAGWISDPAANALPESEGDRPRILLADDNADMREYVRHILAERFEVEAVADGQAALEAARRQAPDLVLTDVMMPRLDGYGLLKALREDLVLRSTSVIMLSARAGEEARIEGLWAGADDYLVKPFSAKELLARVATHLEMTRLRRDTTTLDEHRRNEAALRESQAVLDFTLESAHVGDWDLDLVHDTSRRSLRHDQCFGYDQRIPESEWGFERFIGHVHPEDRDRVAKKFSESLGGDEDWHFECRVVWPDETVHWIAAHGSIYRTEGGKPTRMLGIVMDITAQKEAKAELEKRVEERTEELTRANRDLDQFAYSVAHDLRAPLRAIVSTSRILMEDAGDRLTEDELDTLRRQATSGVRLAKIVDDLLSFAKLANSEPHRIEFDMTTLARNTAAEVSLRRKGCQIDVQEEMRALGDPSLLGYALTNLLDNACKFSPAGGTVTVGQTGGNFFVRDQGVGFDMKHAEKLFVAFERLVGQEDFEGTGVGLANVARIVERHGGKIWAESEPGKGATFFFTLA